MKVNEMGSACSPYEDDDKYVHKFNSSFEASTTVIFYVEVFGIWRHVMLW
jgi:hypothetical protein